jgi:hypothetical protein
VTSRSGIVPTEIQKWPIAGFEAQTKAEIAIAIEIAIKMGRASSNPAKVVESTYLPVNSEEKIPAKLNEADATSVA